jgi:hypothetical protein
VIIVYCKQLLGYHNKQNKKKTENMEENANEYSLSNKNADEKSHLNTVGCLMDMMLH